MMMVQSGDVISYVCLEPSHDDGPKWRRHFLRLLDPYNMMMVQSRDVISFVCLDHAS